MPELSDLEKYSEAPGTEGAVGYWIYNVKDDSLRLSEGIKNVLGFESCIDCSFTKFKSLILGVDVAKFTTGFDNWINGDTSQLIQVRLVDKFNQIRTIQIKGRLRSDIEDDDILLYGAYIDISFWTN